MGTSMRADVSLPRVNRTRRFLHRNDRAGTLENLFFLTAVGSRSLVPSAAFCARHVVEHATFFLTPFDQRVTPAPPRAVLGVSSGPALINQYGDRPSCDMAEQTILIVDDNPVNLKLIRILLTGEGYDMHTANDAEEAIPLLRELRPRVILMDIQLPGMDGLALTRRLKADPTTRDIMIIGLTAYAMKGDEEKMLAAGCDGYIAKPIDTRTLPGVIQRYLEL